jgi:hypothetical protein
MFSLLASRNESAGTLMKAPLNGSITRAVFRGYTRSNQRRRTRTLLKLSNGLVSIGAEIKSSPGKSTYSFRIHDQIYHLVSPLCPVDTNKPGHTDNFTFSILLKQQRNGLKTNRCNVMIGRDPAPS